RRPFRANPGAPRCALQRRTSRPSASESSARNAGARPRSRSASDRCGTQRLSCRAQKRHSAMSSRRSSQTPVLPPGAEALDLGQAVLACLLLEGAATARAHPITPTAFLTDAHRMVYSTIAQLADRGAAVDLLTVTDTLRSAGQLELAGGAAALSAM